MTDDIRGPIISAVAGFLGVLVGTALVPWVRGFFSRRQAARYLAIRVVCILDRYIDDCTAVACDWGRENQHGDSEAQVTPPRFPTYPSDIDWHSIEYSVMYDLLALSAAAEKVIGIVDNAGEHAPDTDGFFETRSFQYATLGLKAFGLTEKLRAKYRIPDIDRTDWNPISQLEQQLKSIRDAQAARLARWEREVRPHLPPPPL